MPKHPGERPRARHPRRAPVEIAAAGAADSPVIAALLAGILAPPWSREAVADYLRAPGSFALLARPRPRAAPAGFLLARVASDGCDLAAMGVAPAWRRRGIGARLLAAALAQAKRRGARQMFLEVAEANPAARALYRAQGFRAVGRRKGYYGGGADALVMRRPIRPAGGPKNARAGHE